jgi:hypothetical protein
MARLMLQASGVSVVETEAILAAAHRERGESG